MNVNILYIIVSLFLFTFKSSANEFSFINSTGYPKMENISNNSVVSTDIVLGKTYKVGTNNYNISTTTNESVTFKFASDTVLKCNDKTSLNIDNYEQYTLFSVYPQETIYNQYNCNVSLLSGELEVINNGIVNDTNNFYINTKLACVILGNGKFIIKSSNNNSTFMVISGNATVMDNLSRKIYKIKDKDIITFTPRPLLTGKAADHMKNQNVSTFSQLDGDDYATIISELNIMEKQQRQFVFITIESTNVAVKLKN